MKRAAAVEDRGDIDAAMKAWQHLYARGLASRLVCRTLFARWAVCTCGRCGSDAGGAP